MKLKPLADRVVIQSLESEEVVKGGIILPGSAKEKPQMAEVVAVGPGGVVVVTGEIGRASCRERRSPCTSMRAIR